MRVEDEGFPVGKGLFFWCELLVSGSVCLVVCAMFFFVGVLDPRNKKKELTEDQCVDLEDSWDFMSTRYVWIFPTIMVPPNHPS